MGAGERCRGVVVVIVVVVGVVVVGAACGVGISGGASDIGGCGCVRRRVNCLRRIRRSCAICCSRVWRGDVVVWVGG